MDKKAWFLIAFVTGATGRCRLPKCRAFKLTASRRFKHKAFSFPRCARKFPHEPRKRRVLRCLGLPSASTLTKARREKCIVVLLTGYATGSCEKNMVPHKSLALPTACDSKSFRKAEAAYRFTNCVAREGIFARRAKTNLSMCLKRREALRLGRHICSCFADLFFHLPLPFSVILLI